MVTTKPETQVKNTIVSIKVITFRTVFIFSCHVKIAGAKVRKKLSAKHIQIIPLVEAEYRKSLLVGNDRTLFYTEKPIKQ